MIVRGLWGIEIEPSRTYSLLSDASFRISMASIYSFNGPERTSVFIEFQGKKFILCSLIPEKIEQQVIDITCLEDEEIVFRSEGPNCIHLTGNYISQYDSDSEEEEESDLKNIGTEKTLARGLSKSPGITSFEHEDASSTVDVDAKEMNDSDTDDEGIDGNSFKMPIIYEYLESLRPQNRYSDHNSFVEDPTIQSMNHQQHDQLSLNSLAKSKVKAGIKKKNLTNSHEEEENGIIVIDSGQTSDVESDSSEQTLSTETTDQSSEDESAPDTVQKTASKVDGEPTKYDINSDQDSNVDDTEGNATKEIVGAQDNRVTSAGDEKDPVTTKSPSENKTINRGKFAIFKDESNLESIKELSPPLISTKSTPQLKKAAKKKAKQAPANEKYKPASPSPSVNSSTETAKSTPSNSKNAAKSEANVNMKTRTKITAEASSSKNQPIKSSATQSSSSKIPAATKLKATKNAVKKDGAKNYNNNKSQANSNKLNSTNNKKVPTGKKDLTASNSQNSNNISTNKPNKFNVDCSKSKHEDLKSPEQSPSSDESDTHTSSTSKSTTLSVETEVNKTNVNNTKKSSTKGEASSNSISLQDALYEDVQRRAVNRYPKRKREPENERNLQLMAKADAKMAAQVKGKRRRKKVKKSATELQALVR